MSDLIACAQPQCNLSHYADGDSDDRDGNGITFHDADVDFGTVSSEIYENHTTGEITRYLGVTDDVECVRPADLRAALDWLQNGR